MIKAILWDNDGVLVDTERLYFRATQEILHAVGFVLTKELFREFSLVKNSGVWHLLIEQGVAEKEIDILRKQRNARYTELLSGADLEIPGARETLSRLKDHFVMCVVTSSRKDHFDIIHQKTEFSSYFDFVLTSGDYSATKPSPEPYLRAVEIAGFPKEECLVIEDSQRGLLAAKNAEVQCWVIPGELSQGSDFSAADRVLNNISEVAAYLLPA